MGSCCFGGRLETQSSFDLEVSRRFCGAKSFNDPEYQPLKALRQRLRESEIVSSYTEAGRARPFSLNRFNRAVTTRFIASPTCGRIL